MRMRRKKHLQERLEACNVWMVTELPEGGWQEIFDNARPVHVEIGCGKGKFVAEMAQRHPEINFVAVEKCPDVLVLAMERTKEADLGNVRFVSGDIIALNDLFPDGTVELIYLNFSDPWPKNGTAKRRLTAEGFLNLYRRMLKSGGGIWMKTDNRKLFEFSLSNFEQNGFRLDHVCYDLHHSEFQDNVMTEYEMRFSEQGMPIYRLEAYTE